LLALGVPIAFSLFIAPLLTLIIFPSPYPIIVLIQRIFVGVDMFALMAVPLFMLTGILMGKAGITTRLVDFASTLVGRYKGGFAYIATITSMIFAGISGSGVADTAATGSITIPAMKSRGYAPAFAASVEASASATGPIIPPSIPMIVYGIVAEVSIGALFAGGIIPGLLIGLSIMLVIWIISHRRGYEGSDQPFSGPEVLRSFVRAVPALIMPIIVLGGIFGGIFTATEASAVGVIYALLVGLFVYRELKVSHLPGIFLETAVIIGTILFLVGTSSAFAWILAAERIPQKMASFLISLSSNRVVILILMNMLCIFAGSILDTVVAITILTPVLLPTIESIGVNPVYFGVLLVVNLAIGLCTPPVGLNLFVGCNMAEIKIENIITTIIPFLMTMISILAILILFPELILIIPRTIGYIQ